MSYDGVCQIRRAIVGTSGNVRLDVKADGVFDWRWCDVPDTIRREALAIGMSAIASGSTIVLAVPDRTADPLTAIIVGAHRPGL